MREMTERSVLPRILEWMGKPASHRAIRRLRLCDIGESAAAQLLEDLMRVTPTRRGVLRVAGEVVLSSRPGPAPKPRPCHARGRGGRVRTRLGDHVYATARRAWSRPRQALREAGQTIATAESCTGGLIASRITECRAHRTTSCRASSRTRTRRRWACWASPPRRSRAWACLSRCAIHGRGRRRRRRRLRPRGNRHRRADGRDADKPVGLVFIAWLTQRTLVERSMWPGTRSQFKARVSQTALNMARKRVLGRL